MSREFDFYPLEERILLSGEGVDGLDGSMEIDFDLEAALLSQLSEADGEAIGDVATPTAQPLTTDQDVIDIATVDVAEAEVLDPAKPIEVVFVDAGVEDADTLLANLRDGSDGQTQWLIVRLQADQDGILQITETLRNLTSVDAVHLLSHGDGEGIQLGNSRLDLDAAPNYAGEIASWGHALDSGADLLIYGCDLASTESGRDLIDILAVVCDCDVAASDNATGNAELGGDWILEYAVGEVNTEVAFGFAAQASWQHTLDIASNLVLHHTFDTDASDSSGNNYDGTLQNGAVINTTSGTNQIGDGKLSLDGTNDYVDFSPHVSNLQGITAGTISVWVYHDVNDRDVIFETSDSGDSDSRVALFRDSDGSFDFYIREGSTTLLDVHTAAGVIPQNTWTHVAVTVDATGNKLYVNGVQQSVTYATGSSSTNRFFDDVTQLDFGSWGVDKYSGSSFTRYFDGFLDDGRVYDRALSSTDISELYAATGTGTSLVSFQQGMNSYTGTQDTELRQTSPGSNYGSYTTLPIDLQNTGSNTESQAMIRFDDLFGTGPGQIPINAQIVSASLTFEAINSTSGTVSLYQMLNDWDESTATWNSLTGGLNANNVEMSSVADSQLTNPSTGSVTFTGLESAVQSWANGSANYGWGILTNSTDGIDFYSSEGTTKPKLSIEYVMPGSQLSTAHALVVDTASDVWDGDTTSIDALLADKGSDGKISLREAILAANATQNNGATPDQITFAIGSGGQTIFVGAGGLPIIVDAVNIDARTQPGYTSSPLITIDGSGATGSTGGLVLRTNDSTISGFAVINFPDEGIEIDGSTGYGDNNIIQYNYVGLTASGNAAGNADDGILLSEDADDNIVRNNVVGSNGNDGIVIRNTDSDNNWVYGNTVGLASDGTTIRANGRYGVSVYDAGTSNIVGSNGDASNDAAERNVISGNTSDGIYLYNASGTEIRGNYVGTNSAGTAIRGNTGYGILISDSSSVIIDANVVSGNSLAGISLWETGTTLATVTRNYIGTNAAGTSALGNSNDGIKIGGGASNNTIGGDRTLGLGNVISGNSGATSDGIELSGSAGSTNDNKIYGNYIGTNATGTAAIANGRHGIVVYSGAQDTLIGGTGSGQGNIISGNTTYGIIVDGNNGTTTTGTVIAANYIGLNLAGTTAIANGGGGISLFGGARSTTIGGTTAAHRNVISGNTGTGINITSATTQSNTVAGNYIGLGADGNTIVANTGQGLSITSAAFNNTIGGLTSASKNVISGNAGFGVYIASASTGNLVLSNYIGTDAAGTGAKANLDGIWIEGANNTIGQAGAGNLISGNSYYGLTLDGANANNNTVQNNYIGTNAAGTGPVANGADGVSVINGAHDNLIGGTLATQRNIISGNAGDGIQISGLTSNANTIQGNYIGTDVTGSADLGNAGNGIYVTGGDNLVVDGNLVSGNDGYGIYLSSTGVTNATVTGNTIGLNATGTASLMNGNHALYLNSTSNAMIGGTTVAERNVINSAGGTYAVYLLGTSDTSIIGNFIGTDALGTTRLSGGSFAINNSLSANTIIGGTTAAHSNVIGGYSVTGINISGAASAGTQVQGNYVGTDSGETLDLTNGVYGIVLQSSAAGILIGGSGTNSGNTIANNSTNGIRVFSSAGAGNSFLRNRIFNNGAIGIDLDGDGVTNNDQDDVDGGVNNGQNFPVITQAVLVGTNLTVSGTIDTDGPLNTKYHVEFYGNVSGTQDSTHGEGRYYLGTTTVTVDGSGDGTFSEFVLTGVTLSVGDFVTATATRIDDPGQVGGDDQLAYGDTSEFAANFAIAPLNSDPVVTFGSGNITYVENAGAVFIDAAATVTDADGTDFDGGVLSISITANGSGADRIRINNEGMAAGLVGTTTGPNEVYYGGVLIGTWSGSGAPLAITFNASADATAVQAVVQNITFENNSDVPSSLTRTVEFQLTDGDGGTSTAITKDIDVTPVNDAPTFGSDGDGSTTVPIPGSLFDLGFNSVVQADGKIVMVGSSYFAANDITVVRFNTNGTLDLTFGGGDGIATLDAGGGELGMDVALQADGKIVVAGTRDGDLIVARFTAAGVLDATFDSDGYAITDVNGTDSASGIAIQSDGKIVVLGNTDAGGNNFSVVRYNTDGSLDTTFSGDGKVEIDFGASSDDVSNSILIQSDGKIVVAGKSNNQFAIARLTSGGVLDTSFDTDGLVTTDFGVGDETISGLAQQSDGKIIAAGTANLDFALARYNTDGSLDTSFDGDGLQTSDLGATERAYSVAYTSTGKIVVSGVTDLMGSNDVMLQRYNADGSLDTSFNTVGTVITVTNTTNEYAYSVQVLANGSISVAGNMQSNGFLLNQYNEDGSLDTSFAPTANLVDANPTYVEGSAPIVLDASVSVFDRDLSAQDNFSGSTIALLRRVGANGEDVFGFSDGNGLTVSAGSLYKNGQIIATFTLTTPGLAVVTFTDTNGETPTQTDVNNVLRQFTYANNSDTPPAEVELLWYFLDGNTGDQGTGASQFITGVTTVNITAINDDPTNAGSLPSDITVTEDVSGNVDLSQINLSDVDHGGGDLTVTLTTSTGGNLSASSGGGVTIGGSGTGILTLTGTLADLNTYLDTASNIQYLHSTPDQTGDNADTIAVSVNDNGNTGTGGGADVNLGSVNVDITNVNDAPVISSDGGGATASINVNENSTAVTTVTASDADVPSQTLTYSKIGGADAALFTIDSLTGVLSFITAPDYENPTDTGGDNGYEVVIQVSDGTLTDTQTITVTVTDVADGIRVTPISVSPIGDETRVNTTTGDIQSINAGIAQAIATDASGNYIVVWSSNGQDGDVYGVYGQRFDADGQALGVEFQINTTSTDQQFSPTVAMDAAGNFVVTWMSNLQDGDGYGVYAQRYNAAGVAQGGEFLVNTTTSSSQTSPAIAMAADGSFAITWTDSVLDPDGSIGIYAQRFDANGVATGGEFRVNSYTTGVQQITSIAMDDAGNFVIMWASNGQDGSNYGVYAQRFDSAGVALDSEFRVNTTTTDAQLYHDVSMLSDGRFVVAFQSRSGSDFEVYIQRYAADGTPEGGETQVNTLTVSGVQPIPSISADDAGNITVVWNSTADGDGTAVIGQRMDWSGTKLGGEFIVNSTSSGNQTYPEVVAQPGGRFIVAWGGNGDGDADGVFMQRYGLSTTEAGGTATFEIVLESQPSADVTIPIMVSDGSEGSVSVGSVTFTSLDWNTPQTVTVTGLQDYANDGDQSYTLVLGTATSSDANFNGLDPEDLVIVNAEVPNVSPVNTVPGDQTTSEDSSLVFSSGNANAITISDTDAGVNELEVTLTATNGTISLATLSGLTFSNGDGTSDSTMTFTGSLSDINTALNGLSFAPTADFSGAAALSIVTNDQGNTGTGGALSDTDVVNITVTAVNDAPVITSNSGGNTASININENSTAVTTVTASDVDLPAQTLTYSIFGGADAAKFSINSSDGTLIFVAAPDFESPSDVGGDNVYDVIVRVSDGSLTDDQAIAVTVIDVSNVLVVTTATDNNDSGILVGASYDIEWLNANQGADGKISLREAIIAANNTAGLDTVSFNIAGAGVHTIGLLSVLPNITDAIVIDGYTQSGSSINTATNGSNAVLQIELNGTSVGGAGIRLAAGSDGSTIRGLVVNRFTGSGIDINNSDNNTIAGNFIGTSADGTSGAGNAYGVYVSNGANNNTIGGSAAGDMNVISGSTTAGVYVTSSDNIVAGNLVGLNAVGSAAIANIRGVYVVNAANTLIGGTAAGAGNVISGNSIDGVLVTGASSAGTLIQGNFIGTNAAGDAGIANLIKGVGLTSGATGVTVGGSAAGAGNVVSGNTNTGVYVASDGNLVTGNFVGLNAAGTAAVANGTGVYIYQSANNTIGGTNANERNVISGNTSNGVYISGASSTGNKVQGNYIGTNAAGTAGVSSTGTGVSIAASAANNTIGGSIAGAGNVISGHSTYGVYINAANNTVAGNTIGLNAAGTVAIANNYGVHILNSANNVIGGTTAAARNVISGNAVDGVYISGAGSTGNLIQGNYIGTNAAGTSAIGNGRFGLSLLNNASANTIGGAISGAGNLISGNVSAGVYVSASDNTLLGNTIGLDVTGSSAIANTTGVYVVNASGTMIGGTTALARNVISGNTNDGIYIAGATATGNVVQGNYIGINAAGTSAIANTNAGISIQASATGNTIGGTTAGAGNVISGNQSMGVYVNAPNNTLSGNIIGLNAAGTAKVANAGHGVYVTSAGTGTQIGGTTSLARNVVSGNGADGIVVDGGGSSSAMNVMIQGNYVGTNLAGTSGLSNSRHGVYFYNGAANNTLGGAVSGAGNVISGNASYGVLVEGTSNLVAGNTIGLDAAGTAAIANSTGVYINNVGSTTIGGTTALARNVISGNTNDGVYIIGAAATGNLVQGNYIGTNAAGTTAVGNGNAGINIASTAAGNTIGGTAAGAGNLISGNTNYGVYTAASDTTIQGNLIGTDAAGTGAIANGADNSATGGIYIAGGSGSTIGGTTTSSRNLISGNGGAGIWINAGGDTTTIQGNYIGVDVTGDTALGNGRWGVVNQSGNNVQIGGTAAGAGNVISGSTNSSGGVFIGPTADGTVIEGNRIGIGATTTSALSSVQVVGIWLASGSSNTRIGGTTAPAGNIIAGNGVSGGIKVAGTSTGNTIQRNSIYGNLGIGIDLNDDGTTTNDGAKTAGAANLLMDSPVVGTANLVSNDLLLTGYVGSAANQATFANSRVEFFISDESSAYGSGQTFLGFLTTDASGNFSGTLDVTGLGLTQNHSITATATDSSGNTSEFGVNFAVNVAPAAVTDNATAVEAGGVGNATAGTNPTGNVLANDSDPDSGDSQTVIGVAAGTVGSASSNVGSNVTGSFGTIQIAANGAYVYTVDNSNAAVQALRNSGDTLTDVFTYTMNDSGGLESTTQVTITIEGANDAPEAADITKTINEDTPLTLAAADFGFTDVDSSESMSAVRIDVLPAAGTLNLTGSGPVTAGQVITIADINAGKLIFTPAANDNGSGYASIAFSVADASNTFDGSPNTITFDVTAVNDAPELDNSETFTLTGITEDQTNNSGNTVASIIASLSGNRITDVDASPSEGIAIQSISGGNGTWQYSLDGSTWTDVGTVNSGASLLLRSSDYLRYVPDAMNADTSSVSFVAWDQTTGTEGTKVSTAATGGITEFSADVGLAEVTVTAVNDAPTITDSATVNLTGTNEDTPSTPTSVNSIVSSAGWADVDTGAAKGIAVTALTGNGTWQYSTDGSTWTSFSGISGSTALLLNASTQIRYQPDSLNGETATFDFVAWDTTTGSASAFGSPSYADPGSGGGTTAYSSESATASIVVTDVNDAVVAVADSDTATEAGGVANATAGSNPSGNVLTNDIEYDTGDTLNVTGVAAGTVASASGNVGTSVTGTYGDISIGANGVYTYTVDNNNAIVQALRTSGQTITDTFTYTVQDSGGSFSSTQIVITIQGQNDAPVAVTDNVVAVEAGGENNASVGTNPTGNVLTNDTDVDSGDTKTVTGVVVGTAGSASGNVASALAGSYGSITINANGSYVYNVDNNNAAVQALRTSSDTLQDVFTYTMQDTDGSSSTTQVTVTIQGQNDDPVAVDDNAIAVEAGGTSNGTAGTNPTGNVLSNDTDVDSGDSKTVVGVAAGSQSVASGSVATGVAGSYGSIQIDANGSYSYTVDNNNAAVQALRTSGQSLAEVFTYTIQDASGADSTAEITVTITGANDAPDAVANAATATEASGILNNISGTNPSGNVLTNDTDVDAGDTKTVTGVDSGVQVTTSGNVGSTVVGTYGSLVINANGTYTYTLDNDNAAVEALNDGDSLSETFSYTMQDTAGLASTTQLVITIDGRTDLPFAVADMDTSEEAGGVENASPGTNPSGNVLDNDVSGNGKTIVGVAAGSTGSASGSVGVSVTGTYGTVVINSDGTYTYTLDNSNPAVEALLTSGDHVTDIFTYSMEDTFMNVSSTELTITVDGQNDAPDSVDDTSIAVESGGVANGTVGSNATGNVLSNDTDVDSGDTKSVIGVELGTVGSASGSVGASVTGNYGQIVINSDGS